MPFNASDSSPLPSLTTSASHSSMKSTCLPLVSPNTLNQSNTYPRRPLTPSSLRDVNLNNSSDVPKRKYAAPLTGHDLMTMFPPAPPEMYTRELSTSGFFARQERIFFAQAGKEIVRVGGKIDTENGVDANIKCRGRDVSRS